MLPALILARLLDTGGIESDVSKYSRHLRRHGIDAHVCCLRPGGVQWEAMQAHGIPLLELPISSFKSRSALSAALALRRYVAQHKISILHAFDLPSDLFGISVGRMLRMPVTISSELWRRDRLTARYRLLSTLVDRCATGVVVNCDSIAKDLAESWHVPPSHIHVCYNGIETEVFHANGRFTAPKSADESVVIGAVTLFRPVKNLSLLIDAFSDVVRIEPRARLLLVGNGPTRQDVERQVEQFGISPYCVFEDVTSTPERWMRVIDIFVSCSTSEGLSNSLLESMASGCCPVASRVGGSPEVIAHGQNGMLFESGNRQELAAALLFLIRNGAARQAFAAAAVRRIQERFTMDAAASRLAMVYRTLLRDSNGGGHACGW